MFKKEGYRRFCVQNTLLAGDATKVLLTVTAPLQIVVTYARAIGIISAAQACYVGDTSGTVRVINLAASGLAVGAQVDTILDIGLPLTVAENLVITPAAAGPSIHVVCEGFIQNFVTP